MSEVKTSGGRVNLGLLFPLIGVLIFWYVFLGGVYTESLIGAGLWPGVPYNSDTTKLVHPFTYLSLAGIAALVGFSLLGRRFAGKKLAADPTLRLNRNTYALTTVAIITSLIAAAIYVLAIFIANQSWGSSVEKDPVTRLLQLYVPVILGAGVLLFGILRAFVVKPKVAKHD
jgi:NADH:ubiquinone oxidoreductase subunit 2 (subunit N)